MKAIEVENLHYTYPEGEKVLKEIYFQIDKGETVGIVGLSGCGKTTLCHCLSGFVPHVLGGKMTGRVLVNGQETRTMKLARLACQIGMIFQEPDIQLIATTVEDEIAFAPENLCLPPEQIRSRVDEILELLGINTLRLKNPQRLSGGQKHLVALGAVMALQPSILVLDEPMSHLDEKGRKMVREILLALRRQGKTLIVVEHDFRNIDFADHLLVIENGCLIRIDTPEKLLADKEFLKAHHLFFEYNKAFNK